MNDFLQEVKQLRGQLNSAQRDIMVEVQTHLAENVYDLLMGRFLYTRVRNGKGDRV